MANQKRGGGGNNERSLGQRALGALEVAIDIAISASDTLVAKTLGIGSLIMDGFELLDAARDIFRIQENQQGIRPMQPITDFDRELCIASQDKNHVSNPHFTSGWDADRLARALYCLDLLTPDSVSPLVLDLDGDGVETGERLFMDYAGDGFHEMTNWAGRDDGVLFVDRNDDGVINDGSELLGNHTPLANGELAEHGFSALADLDTNDDGQVDASDSSWSSIKVMVYRPGETEDEQGGYEAASLAELGITSLGTGYEESTAVDAQGNEHRQVGSYTRSDGTTRTMTDVWFQTNNEVTFYSGADIPEHDESIESLPDITGKGMVYDLRDAMALDKEDRLSTPFYTGTRTETRKLHELVDAFAKAGSVQQREALLERIIQRWTGAEGVDTNDYWPGRNHPMFIEPFKVAVVEAFNGERWLGDQQYRNPTLGSAHVFNVQYTHLKENLYGSLMIQTHLQDLYASIEYVADDDGNLTGLDSTEALALLGSGEDAKTRRAELVRALAGTTQGELLPTDSVLAYEVSYQVAKNWRLFKTHQERDVVVLVPENTSPSNLRTYRRGGGRGGTLARRRLRTIVVTLPQGYEGSIGKDVFHSDDSEDDYYEGKAGGDVYLLGPGTGRDRIYENSGFSDPASSPDVVMVDPGFGPDDVRLRRNGQHLWIELLDGDSQGANSLRVTNFFNSEAAQVEQVLFSDGTSWGVEELRSVALRGGDGDDNLNGSPMTDIFDADAGGNDTLYGRDGDDVYHLGAGTGHDIIREGWRRINSEGDAGDVIEIDEGYGPDDVRLRRDEKHLWVELLGEADEDGNREVTDSLKVEDYFVKDSAEIEVIRFSDGTTSVSNGLMVHSAPGGEGSDSIYGGALPDVFDADGGGNDRLYGRGGNDVYRLGTGTGHDVIYEGKRDSSHSREDAGDDGDVIEVEAGYGIDDVLLRRDEHHLWIGLLGEADDDGNREVKDSLLVHDHFEKAEARVESVRLHDGTTWTDADFRAVALRGGEDNDKIHGRSDMADIFNSDGGGNDRLYGRGGDDVYRLGSGTGHDAVYEGWHGHGSRRDYAGDDGDVIEVEAGYGIDDVLLRRSEHHLWIGLLGEADADGNREVTDSLLVHDYFEKAEARVESVRLHDGTTWTDADFRAVALRGDSGNHDIHGRSDMSDIFNSDGGGNDRLFGRGGDDVYHLGSGTGYDAIYEGYHAHRHRREAQGDVGDVIEVDAGYSPEDVRLHRDEHHLWVELLGEADENGNRPVTDSLRVHEYYNGVVNQVEVVRLSDGTTWTGEDFRAVARRGGSGNDRIHGRSDMADIFDSDGGGNDSLYGRGGDDVYRLGAGTGHDAVHEGWHGHRSRRDYAGDAGDVIEVAEGYGPGDVRLRRDEHHLWVELLGEPGEDGSRPVTDSLIVVDYYERAEARVEIVRLHDGTTWTDADFRAVALRGGEDNDRIHGRSDMADIFDSDGGGYDSLYGRGGDDVYRLGAGTGHDAVREGWHGRGSRRDYAGDAGDVIEVAEGYGPGDVRLRRDEHHLWVELLGDAGEDGSRPVADSLMVVDYYERAEARVESVRLHDGMTWTDADFRAVALRGGEDNDRIHGRSDMADIFDSDGGGNDSLFGRGGDDVYRLGAGTGHDFVFEGWHGHGLRRDYVGDDGDVIEVEAGYDPGDVRLRRDEHHLWVELLGAAGDDGSRPVTDSLIVIDYYERAEARVESVRLHDGTTWTDADFRAVALRGGEDNDRIHGRSDMADIFDSDGGGNDSLYGRGGDDVYRLGAGTGHDVVYEGWHGHGSRRDYAGDAGDVIEVEEGYGPGDVRLRRDKHHLWVELLGEAGEDGSRPVTDSLIVVDYYERVEARVESVRLHGGTTWTDVDFRAVALHGGEGNEDIQGRSDMSDIFDSDGGGNDELYGGGGDDVYRLGSGTGHDVIYEGYNDHGSHQRRRDAGDTGDAIEVKAGYGADDVRLRRDEHHLWVELLGAAGEDGRRKVTDSLRVHEHFNGGAHQVESVLLHDGTTWGDADFRAVALRGGEGNENIHGRSDMADVFDSDGGGDDRLYGRGGDDVYRLGSGTGHDVIHEGLHSGGYNDVRRDPADAGDTIEVEAGYGADDVRLRRDEHHLWVELLGAAGEDGRREVTDSLMVHEHFKGGAHQVESVRLHDGTTWGDADFRAVALRGGEGNENIHGRSDMADVFDSDGGGNDRLYGRGGNDVYRLGSGTGHDVIHEGLHSGGYNDVRRDPADAGDTIEVEAGYRADDVRLRRDEHHLWVELLGAAGENGRREVTDSLRVHDHFNGGAHQVESVRLHDGTTWTDVEFRSVALRGGEGNEDIHGRSDMADVFDSDGGGNDRLYGRGGNDVYRLGSGTGHDVIHEGMNSGFYTDVRRGPADAGDVIEVEAGYGPGDVRLRRDEYHLWVELLGPAGDDGVREATDSLKVHEYFKGGAHQVESVRLHDGTTWTDVEFRSVALRGGEGNEDIHGRPDMADVFDSDGGGDDKLYGSGGDDVYRLGSGTGHDEIHEGMNSGFYTDVRRAPADAGDVIEVEAGYGPGDVRLRRDEHHLWVELLGAAGEDGSREVTDSLRVHDHFNGGAHQVESVRLHDGTTWGDTDLRAAALRGGEGNENIHGRSDMADVFDSDGGGDDRLYGRGGDDVYRLGSGTGHDVIHEGVHSGVYNDVRQDPADAGDTIEVEAGYGADDVRLRRDEHHLWVDLLGAAGENGSREATDSLRVHDHFNGGAHQVESVRLHDGTTWGDADFRAVALRGGEGNENIHGRSDMADVFDSDGGGDDRLFGRGGDDVYRLGTGTGHDVIHEGVHSGVYNDVRRAPADAGDAIEVEAGYGADDVRLDRDEHHLWVELLGAAGENGHRAVTDSLQVHDYFKEGVAEVESIRFASGAEWQGKFVVGTSGSDSLSSEQGGSTIYGGEGDDTYSFASGFGTAQVVDTGGSDRARFNDWAHSDLQFSREGSDMVVDAGGGDRAVFAGWFDSEDRRIEQIEAGDSHIMAAQAERMASAMSQFISDGGTASGFTSQAQGYWEQTLGTPGG